jgi:hypothetical protein
MNRLYQGKLTNGKFERVIILTFVLLGAYVAIGMIFMAKSIARIKEMDDAEIGNYYIIGTFASMSIAMVSGLIINGVKFLLG